MKTKYLVVFLLIFSLSSGVVAQTPTVWGPGENWEIDYLHSGLLSINNTVLTSFDNEPSTEFTLQNVTNDGYDYVYIGYGGILTTGSVSIQSFNVPGFTSIEVPVGQMPVVLPLSYGDNSNWMEKFSAQLNLLEFSRNQQTNISDEMMMDMFNSSSTLTDDLLIIEFEILFNGTVSLANDGVIFQLPQLDENLETYNYTNSFASAYVSYKLSTGVLFDFNFEIEAEEVYDENNNSLGALRTFQQLEFVAIIPPTSIIDNFGLDLSLVPILFGMVTITIILRKRR